MALVSFYWDWDFAHADAEFRKAIQQAPGLALAHHWYAHFLSAMSRHDEATGEVTLLELPRAHGDHVHIGPFVVSSRDISGFSNPAVWTALARKGLAHTDDTQTIGPTLTLTADGIVYDTGLSDRFIAPSDH